MKEHGEEDERAAVSGHDFLCSIKEELPSFDLLCKRTASEVLEGYYQLLFFAVAESLLLLSPTPSHIMNYDAGIL